MIHLGDITKLNGNNVPIVDCAVGGSPCQGLSVAGKRGGLDDERSGLFINQVKIIKEMRETYVRTFGRTDNIRPRYMVWENVPGALSSGTPKGEDFRIVLEETAKVADENAVIPQPPKGKWSNSGCIMGNGWSIAWRVFDNQFWGTPQRRRRIALVADFGGESAPEILFVRKSVSGDTEPSEPQGEEPPSNAAESVGADGREGKCFGFPLGFRPENVILYDECATTLCNGTRPGFTNGIIYCVDQGGGKSACNVTEGTSPTLTCTHGGEPVIALGGVCYLDGGQIAGTLTANNAGGNQRMPDKENFNCVIQDECIVRRLTPMECERLQGFPDGWTDIGEWTDSNGKVRKTSDSARYKALGNSIAIPAWKWVIKRISAQYERDATMASLFDGIGGFPLIWEQLNGKGTCLWASEIEEFPIAVTKKRLGGD